MTTVWVLVVRSLSAVPPLGGRTATALPLSVFLDSALDTEGAATMDDDEGFIHGTRETVILGRDRSLIANADYSHLLLIDHGGGFEPTPEDLFEVINDLVETVIRLRGVGR